MFIRRCYWFLKAGKREREREREKERERKGVINYW